VSKPPVSNSELAVLKVLWTLGSGTIRNIAARLRGRRRRLAYTTVLTLVSRLRDKGYVAADPRDTAHVFRARVSQQELLAQGLSTLADRICDGTSSPLVHALVKGRRLSRKDIADLRRLLDDLERKGRAR
jgi:predicted transcriptional regulator